MAHDVFDFWYNGVVIESILSSVCRESILTPSRPEWIERNACQMMD